jgi:O-antigen/teichoic acid export membrane protein
LWQNFRQKTLKSLVTFLNKLIHRYFSSQSPLTQRLLKGMGAQGLGKALLTAQRLVEVPLFLSAWGINLYGEWLMLTALLRYFEIGDGGFTTAAVREISMRSAAGDRVGALRVFQSIQALLGLVSLGMLALSLFLAPFLMVADWFSLKEIPAQTAIVVLQVFFTSVMLGFYAELQNGAFWCEGHYPRGMFIANLNHAIGLGTFVAVILLGAGPVQLALAALGARILGILIQHFFLRRTLPWLEFGFGAASWHEMKSLTKPALASLAMPLGNALNIQGLRLVVGATLGPAVLVLFSSLRTLARLTMQLRSVINTLILPEMSAAYGKDDHALVAKLLIHSSQLALWLVGLVSLVMALLGGWIVRIWTNGEIAMNWPMYMAMLLAGVVNSMWNTYLTVMVATNRHARLAVAQNLVYGLLTFGLAYAAAVTVGAVGVALVLVFSEALMAAYVVPRALKMAGISPTIWWKQAFQPPFFLLKFIPSRSSKEQA